MDLASRQWHQMIPVRASLARHFQSRKPLFSVQESTSYLCRIAVVVDQKSDTYHVYASVLTYLEFSILNDAICFTCHSIFRAAGQALFNSNWSEVMQN